MYFPKPIEFVKSSGSFDIVSPVINYTGTGVVMTLVGTISYLGLKALGIGETVPVVSALFKDVAVIGGVGAAVAGGLLVVIFIGVVKALGSSR